MGIYWNLGKEMYSETDRCEDEVSGLCAMKFARRAVSSGSSSWSHWPHSELHNLDFSCQLVQVPTKTALGGEG